MMGGMGMGGGMMGSFAGGFNGNLGMRGATRAMPLIQLITTVVAPGQWFTTQQQQAFNNIQGGFGGMNMMGWVAE